MNAWLWAQGLRRLGVPLGLTASVSIWFTSQLMRYAPGSVWHLGGRAYLANREGASAAIVGVSLMAEMLQTLTAALLVGAASLPTWPARGPWSLLVLLAAPLLIFYLHPALLQGRIVRSEGPKPSATGDLRRRDLAILLPGYCLAWVAHGGCLYMLAHSISQETSASLLPALTGMFAIAWAAGFLCVVAPSGLGVREGVLCLLLSSAMPTPTAVVLALLARIWLTVAELGCAAAAIFVSSRWRPIVRSNPGSLKS